MSNTLVIKNSSVTGHVPVGTDLVEAEIAVNTADKKLFTKDAQGNVVEIGMEVNSQTVEAALGFVPANQATTYTKNETNSAIQAVVGAAPAALNTLAEIAAQLASDESAAASIVTLVATKAPQSSTYTKTQVDTAIASATSITGYPVRAISTVNYDVSVQLNFRAAIGVEGTIDGYVMSLATDQNTAIILLTNQTNPTENGLWKLIDPESAAGGGSGYGNGWQGRWYKQNITLAGDYFYYVTPTAGVNNAKLGFIVKRNAAHTIVESSANTGVSAGTYKSITVDAKGRVISGSNPATLSGYGIADAYTKTQVDTALSSMGSSSGSLTQDFSVKTLAVSGDIMPAVSGVSSIGSPTDKFHSIYTQELHIDANTLYVDGVPVIGSSANTIQITADLNQGMHIATSGTGQLILDSQTATTIQTNGTNADVIFQAIGTGSLARITSSTQVVLTAPVVNIQGNESISGDLIVAGNMTVNGTTTAVNTTNMTVKDNIVTVNKGELGSGVSLRYAGFEVDRGDLARERLIWDETVGKWVAGQTSQEAALATEPFVAAAIAASTSSVTLTSLGLGNVSNTSDANKPVSTAQAAAIALKASVADLTTETSARIAADLLLAPQATTYTKTQVDSAIAAENTRATTVEALKANQATTYTKTETDSRIQAVVGAAPAALDTLAEIATQLASDESAASALVTTVSSKASTADLSTLQAALQTLITNEVNRALAAEATKASIASLSVVATSGSYNDLTNKPSNSGATWASFQ